MDKPKVTFDSFVNWLCQKVPWIGPPLGNYYRRHTWFQRFIKFGLSTFVMFWLLKGPIIWLFTDVWGIWYVLSAFIGGLIVTVAGFVLNELWVWAKND